MAANPMSYSIGAARLLTVVAAVFGGLHQPENGLAAGTHRLQRWAYAGGAGASSACSGGLCEGSDAGCRNEKE